MKINYIEQHGSLTLDQVRVSQLGTRYRILAIETTGYVICRVFKRETRRIWCDVVEGWRVVTV